MTNVRFFIDESKIGNQQWSRGKYFRLKLALSTQSDHARLYVYIWSLSPIRLIVTLTSSHLHGTPACAFDLKLWVSTVEVALSAFISLNSPRLYWRTHFYALIKRRILFHRKLFLLLRVTSVHTLWRELSKRTESQFVQILKWLGHKKLVIGHKENGFYTVKQQSGKCITYSLRYR